MGFGVVLRLDDQAVRALQLEVGDEALIGLGASLIGALGESSYPSHLEPLEIGCWQRIGAFHSSQFARLEIDGERARALGPVPPPSPPGAAWQPQLSAGAMNRAYQAAARRPGELSLAAARHGGSVEDAVYGPNRVAGRSLASLWWFSADLIGTRAVNGGLGVAVCALLDTHLGNNPAPGLYKAGSLVLSERVDVMWHGNRICGIEELGESERRLLASMPL